MKFAISLDEFRKNLSDVVGQVIYGNQIIHVRKHNRKGIIVMSEREYESLKDPRKRFSSKEDWEKLFTLTDKVRNRMSLRDNIKLEKVIREELKAVRAKRQQEAS